MNDERPVPDTQSGGRPTPYPENADTRELAVNRLVEVFRGDYDEIDLSEAMGGFESAIRAPLASTIAGLRERIDRQDALWQVRMDAEVTNLADWIAATNRAEAERDALREQVEGLRAAVFGVPMLLRCGMIHVDGHPCPRCKTADRIEAATRPVPAATEGQP